MKDFLKTIHVNFKGKGLVKMEYSDSVERSNEEIISYVKGAYPAGDVVSVFVEEK